MKLREILLATVLSVGVVGSANGAVATYEYMGQPFDQAFDDSDNPIAGTDSEYNFLFGKSYTLKFSIDDKILGLSYKNLHLDFTSCADPTCDAVSDIEKAFTSWEFAPFPEYGPLMPDTYIETSVRLKTDASGNVVVGVVNWLSGPPDGILGGPISDYFGGNTDAGYLLTSGPGVWELVSVSEVPLPASLPLMGIGLLSFAMIARRRKRAG